jgi:hypothetical protein
VKTTRQEGEELGDRCRERAFLAQILLDKATTREEAETIHRALAKDVTRDAMKVCVRVLVQGALKKAAEEVAWMP